MASSNSIALISLDLDDLYKSSKAGAWTGVTGEPTGYNLQHTEGAPNGLYISAYRPSTSRYCIIKYDGSNFTVEVTFGAGESVKCLVTVGTDLWVALSNGKIYRKFGA